MLSNSLLSNPFAEVHVSQAAELRQQFTVIGSASELLAQQTAYDLAVALALDRAACRELKQLCERHQAKIVLSSAWRQGKDLAAVRLLLSYWGLDRLVLDLTPNLERGKAQEIAYWLFDHAESVASYVVFDDIDSGLSDRFGQRFIYCDALLNGLICRKASELLDLEVDDKSLYSL